MFFKLLIEDGIYQKIDTKECVNLLDGNEIYTPQGKVMANNLRGWSKFDTIEQAMEYFNIELIPTEE